MAETIELEPNEIKLAETSAGYQVHLNAGRLALTNRRLIWRMGWLLTPLSLIGQREVIIPVEAIEKCYSRGIMLVVGTPNGDFNFFIRNRWWSWWDDKKVREWVGLIEEAMTRSSHQA